LAKRLKIQYKFNYVLSVAKFCNLTKKTTLILPDFLRRIATLGTVTSTTVSHHVHTETAIDTTVTVNEIRYAFPRGGCPEIWERGRTT